MKKQLWFKNKYIGWGWTPVTWQGWLVVVAYLGIVTLAALLMLDSPVPRAVDYVRFLGLTAALTVVMIAIAYRMGEKPVWMWMGKPVKKR